MSEAFRDEHSRRYGGRRTKMPDWNNDHLAAILGVSGVAMGRWLNGERYPNVDTMKKFEKLFGWPAREQIDLVNPVWEEKDLRYAMVLKQVIDDWKVNNPRTVPANGLSSRFPSKFEDPYGHKARRAKEEEDE